MRAASKAKRARSRKETGDAASSDIDERRGRKRRHKDSLSERAAALGRHERPKNVAKGRLTVSSLSADF